MKLKPQTELVLAHLETGADLTPQDALRRFGCFRLAARVAELRGAGYNVITDRSCGYARYFLEDVA